MGCETKGRRLDRCFFAFPDLAYSSWEARPRAKARWEENSKKAHIQQMLKEIKGKKHKNESEGKTMEAQD